MSAKSPAIDIVATVINSDAPVAHVERKHARCSPSKLKNLEICPSYEGDNDGPPHPITLRGTAMHEAMETGSDLKLDPADTEGVIPGATVEHELVAMCREFEASEVVPGERTILEPHLKTHDPDVQGFADKVVVEPGAKRIRIRDYKFGFNLVDLPNVNPQAIAYTVAAFIEFPTVDEISFAFEIPRMDAILEHTFKRSELPALKLRLSVIADRVRQLAGKEFNLDESNCLYCSRKAQCPKMLEKMLPLRSAVTEADRLPVPADLMIGEASTPEQVGQALNLSRIAEDWVDKVKAFALRYRMELGQEIPGYDLIERKAKREVVNPLAALEVAKEFGVTDGEFISAARISITSLDASVREHAAGNKTEAANAFTDRLTDVGALSRGMPFHVLQKSRKKAKPALAA